jgi:tetratricopeptide (TPR) repeat protein
MRGEMKKAIVLLMIFVLPLQALEIKRVILATDGNPFYKDFWALAAPLWTKMGYRPTLAFIADDDCPIDETLGDVIRFAPLPNVPIAMQAQAVRLLLPALFPDDGCIISDIDMLPISRAYFEEGATHCSDEEFLVYRNMAPGYQFGGKFPMCYMAAKGRVFGSVFGVKNREQIADVLTSWASTNQGWYTDEIFAFMCAKKWEANGGKIVLLNHTVGPRLDRIHWNYDFDTVSVADFIDCHCPRPYSDHKATIDRVVKAISESIDKPQASLEALLQQEMDPAKHEFHLGMSDASCGRYAEAKIHFQKRLTMESSDPQETYLAAYNLAAMNESLGATDEAIDGYLAAHLKRNTRAEPLHKAAVLYRKKGNYFVGYLLEKHAVSLACPVDDLCVDPVVYEYGALIELANCALLMGDFKHGYEACGTLLANASLPPDIRPHVENNRTLAQTQLEKSE